METEHVSDAMIQEIVRYYCNRNAYRRTAKLHEAIEHCLGCKLCPERIMTAYESMPRKAAANK